MEEVWDPEENNLDVKFLIDFACEFQIKFRQNKEPFDSVLAEKKKEGGKDVYVLRDDRPQVLLNCFFF